MTIVSEMAYNKYNIIHLLISISRYEFYFDIIIVAQNIYSRSSERAESETFDAQPAHCTPTIYSAQRVVYSVLFQCEACFKIVYTHHTLSRRSTVRLTADK